ncbi:hypothetical protein GCM10008090_29890 [Arenicella chitinivorans]|uniref:Zinc finger/thioredoxin putative domain-containing protein n=1 Tax=Arenicella chitinivorans TaxID=1329800 RepID=A0A918S311_9GAMM|nr:zinc-ribbon and DUF3426 domain-containing protein [Arenicella chitinivorans]GHA18324.1 hypothetical protein GCM10008090_29890 [Arenicella chitinivorans]
MGLNKTQCPHCFTTYVISDEQFRVSEGMVRCGTCRERFQARLIDASISVPKFDPRGAFIEPISEDTPDTQDTSAPETMEIEFADPHTESNEADADPQLEPNSITVDPDSLSEPSLVDQIVADINAHKEEVEELVAPEPTTPKSRKLATAEKYGQTEIALPASNTETSTPANSGSEPETTSSTDVEKNDSQLIDEVDSLIKDKLIKPKRSNVPLAAPVRTRPRPVARPKSKRQRSAVAGLLRIMMFLLLLALTLGLAALLLYQVWFKQLISIDPQSKLDRQIQQLTLPLSERLAERDIALPVRRNLAQLEIVAARNEPHPTRSSTTLLRVSLINHAEIAQPLPWLELSLMSADGKVVSRRQLSPHDYLYNNQTDAMIGAKELKKVTIEMLTFPKQAVGYELKLIRR